MLDDTYALFYEFLIKLAIVFEPITAGKDQII
jgi:hypothetical protein